MALVSSRGFAIAANMLDDIESETWINRGLSEDDIRLASSLAANFLRIISIELGLKHIINYKMQQDVEHTHDLYKLWKKLDVQWKNKISKKSNFPETKIQDVLERYKSAFENMRYGEGGFGFKPGENNVPMEDRKNSVPILKNLANILGSLVPALESSGEINIDKTIDTKS